MRNPINVLKSLESNACNQEYRYERLYRNLYNPEFYLLAYKNIAKSQGSMTAGTDGKTLNDMSIKRIQQIIDSLKDYSYQPSPARRTYIPKKNNPNKKRPLGIPSTDDKLVQEVVRMILESIYEPTFSPQSHGFRPNRSCHTALLQVKATFTGANWIIEGDIKACFDSFDHHVLIDILRRRIQDEHFISLMWKFLKAGYMENWKYHSTYSGSPQGSGASPILANICLSELDGYMEDKKLTFDKGISNRNSSREYWRAQNVFRKCKKKLKLEGSTQENVRELKQAQQKMLSTPCYPVCDLTLKRIQFNRYADDFVIGIIGSREDAEKVKADVKTFLQEKLKLTMSEEKTKITHSSEFVRYLGYNFTVSHDVSTKRNIRGSLSRQWSGKIRLYVPKEKWVNKLREYKAFKIYHDENGIEKWKATHRGKLMNRPEVEIISKINVEIRGIYNYYRLADNATVLSKFAFIMIGSMYKTFAAKGNTSVAKVRASHTKNGIFGVDYRTKAGPKRCEVYHDGFRKNIKAAPDFADVLPQYRKYEGANSLASRIRRGICELCGKTTNDVHIHHVRQLKDLTDKTEWEKLMKKSRRKSLALCPVCNEKIHANII